MDIAVLVTVHNRVAVTIRGLSKLAAYASQLSDDFKVFVFLVDDGSTDGTVDRIPEIPLAITVARGDGSLYWNRGMSLAYTMARQSGHRFDAYMLYNDDVEIDDGFVAFMRAFQSLNRTILVGAFVDPATSNISYSGFLRRGRFRPLDFDRPKIDRDFVPVDTFNANLVMIPADVFDSLNGLDPAYTHSFGDLDLGLRAKADGVPAYVYGTPIGVCSRGTSLDDRIRAAGLRRRWELLFGHPHGPRPYIRFVKRHGATTLWPMYALYTVLQRVMKLCWRRTGQELS